MSRPFCISVLLCDQVCWWAVRSGWLPCIFFSQACPNVDSFHEELSGSLLTPCKAAVSCNEELGRCHVSVRIKVPTAAPSGACRTRSDAAVMVSTARGSAHAYNLSHHPWQRLSGPAQGWFQVLACGDLMAMGVPCMQGHTLACTIARCL